MGATIAGNGPLAPTVSIPHDEYVGSGHQHSGTFMASAGTLTMSFDLEQQYLEQFVYEALGRSQAAGTQIHRFPPARHPQMQFLHASRINSVEYLAPYGHTDYALWKRVRVAVQFETLPYDTGPSAGGVVDDESTRYVTVDIDPAAEFIQRKQGSYSYFRGATPVQINESGGISQILAKTRLKFTWYQVPDAGLFGTTGFASNGQPSNILNGLGHVNNAVWRGFPKGTLMLEGWKPVPRTQPRGQAGNPVRSWDVDLNLLYFNPQPAGNPAFLGHNLVPDPQEGTWHRAFVTGKSDTSAFWRYPEYDFSKLFQMNT